MSLAIFRVGLRVAGVAAIGLVAANCAGPQLLAGKSSESKYGVKASPRVVEEGEPVPKGGGRNTIGKPYVVAGRTYVPSTTTYRKEGWASWYGTAFHGRLTANGEIFDRDSVVAAHPTMPLPSYVRVTNTLNRRSMIVRVNDRGPYEQDRILDVSERVAEALDFRRRGVARVRIEYVGRASLRGSDDRRLLATLTTDGTPAPFGAKRIMLADLRDEPAPRPTPKPVADEAPAPQPAPIVLASAAAATPEGRADERYPSPVAAAGALEESVVAEAEIADHPMPPPRPGSRSAIQLAAVAETETPPVAERPVQAIAPSSPLPPQRPSLTRVN